MRRPILTMIAICSLAAGVAHAATVEPAAAKFPLQLPTRSAIDFGEELVEADFNGDGHLDLAGADCIDHAVRVAIYRGVATYEPIPTELAVGFCPTAIAAGDLDGDGNDDLVTTNAGLSVPEGSVSVLLSNGDGTFKPAQHYDVGERPEDLTLADLNGDSRLDVAVANRRSGDVSILLNEGGPLGTPTSLVAGLSPVSIVSADFNEDGLLDLAAANRESDDLSIWLGTGNGNFITLPVLAVGDSPVDLVAADFNGDHHTDLATANFAGQDVSLLHGDGNGGFATQVPAALSGAGRKLEAREVTGDGELDLVVLTQAAAELSVLAGNGDGSFAPEQVSDVISRNGDAPPQTFALLDANVDGLADLAYIGGEPTELEIFAGDNSGNFETVPLRSAVNGTSIAGARDLDGDLDFDVVALDAFAPDPYMIVLIANGDGSFEAPVSYPLSSAPSDAAIGLVNGDVHPDIVVSTAGGMSTFLGRGDGTFDPELPSPAGGAGQIALGLIDGDAQLDAVVYDNAFFNVRLGVGNGTFSSAGGWSAEPNGFALGDVSGDGKLDVVSAGDADPSTGLAVVETRYGDGLGGFAQIYRRSLSFEGSVSGIALRDFDGNSALDVVTLAMEADGPEGRVVTLFSTPSSPLGMEQITGGAIEGLRLRDPFVLGDLTGDGTDDLVRRAGGGFGGFGIHAGAPDGTFADAAIDFAASSFLFCCDDGALVLDADLDGVRELVAYDDADRDIVTFESRLPPPPYLGFSDDRVTLSWFPVEIADSFNVYRGELSDLTDLDADGLPDGGYGDCRSDLDADPADTVFVDADLPSAGQGFFYLVSFVRQDGAELGFGTNSAGNTRSPAAPCP